MNAHYVIIFCLLVILLINILMYRQLKSDPLPDPVTHVHDPPSSPTPTPSQSPTNQSYINFPTNQLDPNVSAYLPPAPDLNAYVPFETPPDPRYEFYSERNAYLLPFNYLNFTMPFDRWMYYHFPGYYAPYYQYYWPWAGSSVYDYGGPYGGPYNNYAYAGQDYYYDNDTCGGGGCQSVSNRPGYSRRGWGSRGFNSNPEVQKCRDRNCIERCRGNKCYVDTRPMNKSEYAIDTNSYPTARTGFAGGWGSQKFVNGMASYSGLAANRQGMGGLGGRISRSGFESDPAHQVDRYGGGYANHTNWNSKLNPVPYATKRSSSNPNRPRLYPDAYRVPDRKSPFRTRSPGKSQITYKGFRDIKKKNIEHYGLINDSGFICPEANAPDIIAKSNLCMRPIPNTADADVFIPQNAAFAPLPDYVLQKPPICNDGQSVNLNIKKWNDMPPVVPYTDGLYQATDQYVTDSRSNDQPTNPPRVTKQNVSATNPYDPMVDNTFKFAYDKIIPIANVIDRPFIDPNNNLGSNPKILEMFGQRADCVKCADILEIQTNPELAKQCVNIQCPDVFASLPSNEIYGPTLYNFAPLQRPIADAGSNYFFNYDIEQAQSEADDNIGPDFKCRYGNNKLAVPPGCDKMCKAFQFVNKYNVGSHRPMGSYRIGSGLGTVTQFDKRQEAYNDPPPQF